MTRRAIFWLLLILAVSGSSLIAVWKFTEPSRRYDRVRRLVMNNRGRAPAAWSAEDGESLWGNLSWFETKPPGVSFRENLFWSDMNKDLACRLMGSMEDSDPQEREMGTLVTAHVVQYGENSFGTSYVPWMLPNPSKSHHFSSVADRIHRAIRKNPLLLNSLSEDESLITRECILELAYFYDEPGEFRAIITKMALRDPSLVLQVKAIYILDWLPEYSAARRVLSELVDHSIPQVRLSAAACLAGRKNEKGIAEFGRLLANSSLGLTRHDWWEAAFHLQLKLRSLAPEFANEEANPLLSSNHGLEAARKWSDWLEAQRFEKPPSEPVRKP